MATVKVVDQEKLDDDLLQLIQEAYDCCKDETFYIGVSGGSLPAMLVRVFKRLTNIDWKKWLIFFCDERCVPSASPDSTFGVFKKLLDPPDEKLPLYLSQFVTIDPALKTTRVAEDYLSKMRSRFEKGTKVPRFHVLFLGIGPDGHTCSLFPGHKLLKVRSKAVT